MTKTKTKFKQTEDDFRENQLAEESVEGEVIEKEFVSGWNIDTTSLYTPQPKQTRIYKVITVFPIKNKIVFSYVSDNGVENGIELPIDSNPKFKNLKSGDIIKIEQD